MQSIAKQLELFCSCYYVIFCSLLFDDSRSGSLRLILCGARPSGKRLSCLVIIIEKYLLIMHIVRSGITLLFKMCAVMGINVVEKEKSSIGLDCFE